MDRAKQFRESAAHHNKGRPRTGWRYPSKLRILALEHESTQLATGRPVDAIAKDLEVTARTLKRWRDEQSQPNFLPIALKQEPLETSAGPLQAPSSICVVMPNGLRIEGVSWPQALELMRTFS